MVETKKNYEEDPRFMNWNNGYNSIFKEIDIINNIVFQARVYLEDKAKTSVNLKLFHSKLYAVTRTYGVYIQKQEKNKEKLNEIHNKLNNPNYIKHLSLKNQSVMNYQYGILLELESIWENINTSFSDKGLIIKVTKTTHSDPGTAVARGFS